MSLANSYVDEGNLVGDKTIVFPWPMRQVQVTNDSTNTNLRFKLNESEDYRTLKPLETWVLNKGRVPKLFLASAGCDYRVWGTG